MKVANTFFQNEDTHEITYRKKTTQKVVHPGTQKDTANLIFVLLENGITQSLTCSQTPILTSVWVTK